MRRKGKRKAVNVWCKKGAMHIYFGKKRKRNKEWEGKQHKRSKVKEGRRW